jgi:hypothetical protein
MARRAVPANINKLKSKVKSTVSPPSPDDIVAKGLKLANSQLAEMKEINRKLERIIVVLKGGADPKGDLFGLTKFYK